MSPVTLWTNNRRFNTVLQYSEVVFFVITASFGLNTEDGGSGSLPDHWHQPNISQNSVVTSSSYHPVVSVTSGS
jgi:hypothetical protein